MAQDGEEELDKEELYLRRLDAGLFRLQMIDSIIGNLASLPDEATASRLFRTMARKDIPIDGVTKILAEYADNVGSAEGGAELDEKAKAERQQVASLIQALEKRAAADAQHN